MKVMEEFSWCESNPNGEDKSWWQVKSDGRVSNFIKSRKSKPDGENKSWWKTQGGGRVTWWKTNPDGRLTVVKDLPHGG